MAMEKIAITTNALILIAILNEENKAFLVALPPLVLPVVRPADFALNLNRGDFKRLLNLLDMFNPGGKG